MQRSPTGFWPLQIGGWVIFATAMSLGRVGEWSGPVILLVEWPFAALGFLTTLLLHRIFEQLRIGAASSMRMLVLVVVASYLGGMLWTAAVFTYVHYVAIPLIQFVSPGSAIPFRRGPVLDNTVYNTLTILAWSTLRVVLSYRDAFFEQQAKALRAAADVRDAQLQMLAYQLNPHFLFNTLNSLRALIDEDRDRARQMVTALSRFLRYALVERPLHLASLVEEVEALRGYLAIESIRFEERLAVQLDVEDEAAECLVPAFLLNPLVENAVKHGMPAPGGGPLRIRVSARLTGTGRLSLIVENSGTLGDSIDAPGVDFSANSTANLTADSTAEATLINASGKLGLKNVRARLEHLYAGRHEFSISQHGDSVRAALTIPAERSDRRLPSAATAPPSDRMLPHALAGFAAGER